MSMVMSLIRVNEEQLKELLAKPQLIEPFLFGPDYQQQRAARPGCLGGLLGQKAKPVEPAEQVELPPDWPERSEKDELYLDKSWNGIHFLLTGAGLGEGEEPLCYLTGGGTEIGDIDVGYGPARALTGAQVKEFAAALAAISDEEFRGRFDPEKVLAAGIYPPFLGENPEEDGAYLVGYFGQLKVFAAESAELGRGLVVWLS